MKIFRLFTYMLLIALMLTSCLKKKFSGMPRLKNEIDSISYYTGIFASRTLQNMDHPECNTEIFYQGLSNALHETNPILTKGEVDLIIGSYFNKFRNIQSERSIREGLTFLSWNKTRKGVITDTSGLQYEVIREGQGVNPEINDLVLIRYKGYFIDGKEFVNSYRQGHPDTFFMNTSVLPGFYIALQRMKPGSVFKIYLPPTLGFGMTPPPIEGFKPNTTVIFDLELISCIPQQNKLRRRSKHK